MNIDLKNIKQCSKDDFYNSIMNCKENIVSNVMGGKYPYSTVFSCQNGRMFGKKVPDEDEDGYLYFLFEQSSNP